ncbi:MAG TPA: hypothetical protein VLX29_04080 [Nitrospirota bacterium]|nr:hypothetical protein [Nitrospirota bacterium]
MKKLFLGTILLALATVVPIPTMAAVNVSIDFPLPPPIIYPAPPDVIAMPDTNDVYVAPNIGEDLFFWNGWWWRPWEGRWYRSRFYDRGWAFYHKVPNFYFDVDPGWRAHYRDHTWNGQPWNYERIPNQRLQQNWKSWHANRYWEKQGNWGVKGYQPRPQQQRQELRNQRQQQYQQRPEVQRHQQQMQEKQRQQQQGQRHGQNPRKRQGKEESEHR